MQTHLLKAKELVDIAVSPDKHISEKEFEKKIKKLLRQMSDDELVEWRWYYIKKASPDFYEKITTDLNYTSKAIAAYVRLNMEDFHHEHLSDAQMKELNPLIRNAIYTALIDLNDNPLRVRGVTWLNLPSYWEGCEYMEVV